MKRFYVFWFFFCAGWGALMSEPFPPGYIPRSFLLATASLPVSALTFFLLLSFELWRLGPTKKPLSPSLSSKPWHMPFGLSVFVFVTFLFSSLWGVLFALIKDNGQVTEPFHFLMLSVGGLIGTRGVYRVFPTRFSA